MSTNGNAKISQEEIQLEILLGNMIRMVNKINTGKHPRIGLEYLPVMKIGLELFNGLNDNHPIRRQYNTAQLASAYSTIQTYVEVNILDWLRTSKI